MEKVVGPSEPGQDLLGRECLLQQGDSLLWVQPQSSGRSLLRLVFSLCPCFHLLLSQEKEPPGSFLTLRTYSLRLLKVSLLSFSLPALETGSPWFPLEFCQNSWHLWLLSPDRTGPANPETSGRHSGSLVIYFYE